MADPVEDDDLPRAVVRLAPGFTNLRAYQRRWLRSDVVAGLVLAAVLVPQGMAYAELAGLPPVNGLYTTIACLVGYAIAGPSRVLVLGPDSSVSPLIFAAVVPLVTTVDDAGEAIELAALMALMVGVIEVLLGVARLGFIADLLSKEVQVGYLNGLAISIIVGQLPKLCGFSTDADGVLDELRAFAEAFDQRSTTSIAVGLATLAVLLLLPRFTRVVPAVLVAVVGATAATALFDLAVSTVGSLPQGLAPPDVPWTGTDDLLPLAIAAVGITLVSLTDTIATSSSFNARRGDEVDPNQEMTGIGVANLAAGLFQGFAVSTSGSRTAVAEQAGATSQVAGLVGAGLVALMLVAAPSLLADLPQPALAAIVIAAALSLADLGALRRFGRVRRSALVISLVATGGVVFAGVIEGIVAAIALSILLVFQRSWWPHGDVLGRFDGRDGWHRIGAADDDAIVRHDVIVFRWEAPLFFANAGMFRQQLRHHVHEQQPRWVVLQCAAITDIDVTAAEVLERLDLELNEQGIHVAFVEMRSRLRELLEQYGLIGTLDREHFFDSIEAALAVIDD